MSDPKCAVGTGGPFVIPPSGLEPGCPRPWHISWLPKGYSPAHGNFIIAIVAVPPGEDWDCFGFCKGERPPMIEAICTAIEANMGAPPLNSLGEE